LLIERLRRQHRIDQLLAQHVAELAAAGHVPARPRAIVAALRQGRLSAFVASAHGTAVGLLCWSARDGRGVVQLLLAAPPDRELVAGALLEAAVPALANAGARQIVHPLRQAEPEPFRRAFARAGFAEVRVEKLTHERPAAVPVPAVPDGYCLADWQESYADEVAGIFQMLPRDPSDAILWPDLATPAGALDLVRTLAGEASFVATPDFRSLQDFGSLLPIVGYVLAQRCRDGSGRIGELGVAPAHQGRGLGKALLTAAMHALARAGAASVWLTVLASNAPAAGLYASLGFRPTDEQSVFLWPG